MLKRFMVLIAVFLLSGVSTVQTFADEVNPQTSKYVNSIEMKDVTDSQAKQYNVDDMMLITWNFDIPGGSDIKAGDTTKFYVPLNFSIDKATAIPGADSNGAIDFTDQSTGKVLGKTTVEDHYVVITWNQDGADLIKNQGLSGKSDALVGWNLPDKKHESKEVPISWGVDSSVKTPSAPTVEPSDPTPAPVTPDAGNDFIINKSGDYGNKTEAGYIYWKIRLDGKQEKLTDAVLTDTIGSGQTLATDKGIAVFTHDIAADGTWGPQQYVNPQPKITTHYDKKSKGITSFSVDLGTITKGTVVYYYTKYDYKNTSDGTAFTNSAILHAKETTDTAIDVPTAHKYFDYKTIINPHGRPKASDWKAAPSSTFAAVTDTKIKGYRIADDSENKDVSTTADSSSSESTIYYDRNVTPVTPDNPHGHASDVLKKVRHVIHYVDRAGHKVHDDTVQVIVYKRDGELDENGNFTATSDWKAEPSDTFAAVELPTVDGYKVFDDSENKAVITTADSTDSESTIVYDKEATPVPDVKPVPNTPDTPQPDVNPSPKVPGVRPKSNPFVLPNTGGGNENDAVSEKSTNSTSTELPQTGKNENNRVVGQFAIFTSVLGMSLFFWFTSQKRKNNKS
ncbi:hypothetical protein H7198_01530 [Fructobacillus sp. CRL 2054]|uniref:mucin-binding protein n=1 Tax=Fructobacillus sp. CRL 2054 TaxID=2763007 RepID=UPI0023799AB0|nr:collagen binding domain-containing protein [Fructobacillus sp. CRL 2054]MDD9138293.1 hypothetical protein [Fructobacillus sp. CRL 2054]